ncbi:MAG: histidine phosphatase family protein [Burkholderiaceae bacterium]|nr:histidine phosphatase family protein [Burkholderiaceae bacterium]MCD8516775.1 histidine phosphatase family protein [Burkholderiaceae bacterium]MCD8536664.1 histidine phosphatase family protein [Burkholderiaceae bacterium]MCD8564396.1 histidine phosphatase family protein [Burkholderiaceae bacterium]
MINLIKRCGPMLMLTLLVFALTAPLKAAAGDTRSLVLLLRHAYAPGGGDPANFDVNDCSTQRNLNDQGREQARDIGRQLKALGIAPTAVWSSQWCRSFETAELMDLGEVKPLPVLNSFFQNRAAGPTQMAELRSFLKDLDPKGGPYIMSSHQVVVSAIANTWVNSGDGVWLELTGNPDEPWRIYPAKTQQLSLPPGF